MLKYYYGKAFGDHRCIHIRKEKIPMKILVITGSPHKQGTSDLMAECFMDGAQAAGHEIFRFDAASKNIGPCIACNYCRKNNGECVQNDDMALLYSDLKSADMVVFVTPLYYFGMTSQIKRVIDRFFAINQDLKGAGKKAALLATCGDTDSWAMDALTAHYQTVCRYLEWEDTGTILAFGVYERKDIENSDYPSKAFEFGKSLAGN